MDDGSRPRHLRDANIAGTSGKCERQHLNCERVAAPRGAFSFCYFFFGQAKKK